MKAFAEGRRYPVYLTQCFLFTRAMSGIEDFRYRVVDDRIVLYDGLEIAAATLPAPKGASGFTMATMRRISRRFLRRAEMEWQTSPRKSEYQGHGRGKHDPLHGGSLSGVRFTGITHGLPVDRTDGRARVASVSSSRRVIA